jgi:hypothetical protein
MARRSGGLTLILALALLVAVPVGTMVWYKGWRARLLQPLPPLPTHTAAELAQHEQPTPRPSRAELRPVVELLLGVLLGNGP